MYDHLKTVLIIGIYHKGIELLTKLGQLREQGSVNNPICNCVEDIETSSCYLLPRSNYIPEKVILLNAVRRNDTNILDLNYGQLTEPFNIIKNVDKKNKTRLLDASKNYFSFEDLKI